MCLRIIQSAAETRRPCALHSIFLLIEWVWHAKGRKVFLSNAHATRYIDCTDLSSPDTHVYWFIRMHIRRSVPIIQQWKPYFCSSFSALSFVNLLWSGRNGPYVNEDRSFFQGLAKHTIDCDFKVSRILTHSKFVRMKKCFGDFLCCWWWRRNRIIKFK